MQTLYLDFDTGNARQLGEEEISQEMLQQVDDAQADIFRWNEDTKRFERCQLTVKADEEQFTPVWSPI